MVRTYTLVTKNAAETAKVGEKLGNQLRKKVNGKRKKGRGGALVICLYGELGSGKTTFVQGLAKGVGITARLLSPTFIIVRRYTIPQSVGFLYHVDLYRVQSKEDIAGLGFSEIFTDPASIVVVEWAEKLAGSRPSSRADIWFKTLDNGQHEIKVKEFSI